MSSDEGPIVQSALLRSELVRLRKEKDLTQEQVARALEWSPSKLIRIEGGKNSITKTDLQALLMQYDVASQSRSDRLQDLARGAREAAWWNVYRGEVAGPYLNYVGYEAGAASIRHYHATVLPGLLQTQEYAQALVTGAVATVESAFAIKLRMQRQQELAARAEPPHQFYIVDEAVIRRAIGVRIDPGIMPNQLRHIADTVENSDGRITFRIIPFTAGAYLGLYGPFTVLEFDGPLPDILYLEGGRAPSALITAEYEVTEYRDNFELLLNDALSPEESLELIRRSADELLS